VRVTVCSLFKDGAHTVRYFRALIESQRRDGIDVACSFVEGDSRDDTFEELARWQAQDPRVELVQHHVEPVVDFDDRVRKWAALGNLAIEGALRTDSTHVLWCESVLRSAEVRELLLETRQVGALRRDPAGIERGEQMLAVVRVEMRLGERDAARVHVRSPVSDSVSHRTSAYRLRASDAGRTRSVCARPGMRRATMARTGANTG
jgi:hypothetical protein